LLFIPVRVLSLLLHQEKTRVVSMSGRHPCVRACQGVSSLCQEDILLLHVLSREDV